MNQERKQDRNLISRRNVLKTTGLLSGTFALGRWPSNATAQTSSWAIVALPDTQKYTVSDTLMSYVHDQIDWIVANRSSKNIVFVSHEGDLVEHGSDLTEWKRMDAAMDKLDGVVPYSTSIGNHDYAVTGDRSSSTENFRTYFGQTRYNNYGWFGGAAPNDLGHYQYFSAGGYDFLHLSLEWGVPGTTSDPNTMMGWAKGVLQANKSIPTIITTHSYIWDKRGYEGHATAGQGANSGRSIYNKLVKQNFASQVFMVLNGHWHKADGQWAQVSLDRAGLNIYEMLANYQHYANGGDGWLRLIEFLPSGGANGLDRIRVQTYSPSRDEFMTGGRSQFAFDLSFASRFN